MECLYDYDNKKIILEGERDFDDAVSFTKGEYEYTCEEDFEGELKDLFDGNPYYSYHSSVGDLVEHVLESDEMSDSVVALEFMEMVEKSYMSLLTVKERRELISYAEGSIKEDFENNYGDDIQQSLLLLRLACLCYGFWKKFLIPFTGND